MELRHATFTSWISLCIRKESKQIYNEPHCIYDLGSQEILCLDNVDNFPIFYASIKARSSGFAFNEVFKLALE